ncbi:MAG: AAA family ATPase [Chloroflexi bacterium]|nr:AAA family ATPase [Chloroflexota bacterium]
MPRIISPPLHDHDNLEPAITPGLQQVIKLFDQTLSQDWEMYVQPFLNGLRPDIVLLHPRVGIAVFEVQEAGRMIRRDVIVAQNRICHTKEEIFELYCPRLDERFGRPRTTAGLIFPNLPCDDVKGVLRTDGNLNARSNPRVHPVSGKEQVNSVDLDAIFPSHKQDKEPPAKYMSEEIAEDLRGWLRDPYFSSETREPLELDRRQMDLVTGRTASGYRRIRGPAGSGKSMVLAARASELAAEGKNTLVLTFNITIINYLRSLAYRHRPSGSVPRREPTFMHFHAWCKRVCYVSGHSQEYKDLWKSQRPVLSSDPMTPPEHSQEHEDLWSPESPVVSSDPMTPPERRPRHWILDTGMAELVTQLYERQGGSMPKYDAILVDEGQDYRPLWWDTLRKACNPGGEMLLVADKTQNIYGTAQAWTEEAMNGAGFRGGWLRLDVSYRLPPSYIPYVIKFAERFLTSNKEVDIPAAVQTDFSYPIDLRWVQVDRKEDLASTCVSEAKKMMESIPSDTAIADITILSSVKVGMEVVDTLKRENRIPTVDTFWTEDSVEEEEESGHTIRKERRPYWREKESQRRKLIFGLLMLKSFKKIMRVTTLHSFKGWESRLLIVVIDRANDDEQLALIYTALTRLQRHKLGSKITVICAANELPAYGREWPGSMTKEITRLNTVGDPPPVPVGEPKVDGGGVHPGVPEMGLDFDEGDSRPEQPHRRPVAEVQPARGSGTRLSLRGSLNMGPTCWTCWRVMWPVMDCRDGKRCLSCPSRVSVAKASSFPARSREI